MMRATSFADRTLLEAMHLGAFGPAQAWSADFIGGQITLPGTFGVVDPAGFILIRCVVDQAEILTLAVMPDGRRRGIGSELLRCALAQAADFGCRAMFLEVSEANQPAQALYRRFGFRQVGARPGYYEDGATALVLSRDLDVGVAGTIASKPASD